MDSRTLNQKLQQRKEKLLSYGIFVDNEYLDKYILLIESNVDTKKQKYKTERHHILPVKYFKLEKLDVDNSPSNTVNLIYKEHVLAHYFLYKCTLYPHNMCNLDAFIKMTFYKIKMTDDEKEELFDSLRDNIQLMYEEYKKLNGDRSRGRKPSAETRKKMSLALKGQKRSEETKQKMRKPKSTTHALHIKEAKTGIKVSADTAAKIKESKQGVHWYTDGVTNVLVRECPLGYRQGRTIEISDYQKQKIREGRKNSDPWNKGLTKEQFPSLCRPNNGKYERKVGK